MPDVKQNKKVATSLGVMTQTPRTTAICYKWMSVSINRYKYTHTYSGANTCCKGTTRNIHTSLVASWCSTNMAALITAPCWWCVTIFLQSCGMCPRDGTWSASDGCACSRHTKALVTVSNSSTCMQPAGVNVFWTNWQLYLNVRPLFWIVVQCCIFKQIHHEYLFIYLFIHSFIHSFILTHQQHQHATSVIFKMSVTLADTSIIYCKALEF
jgi:hypothetical protein